MDDTTFENLDVTPDELQRIEKALKDEQFRKMLVEYAQELRDPENRRKYEEEIAMLEHNRGMDVTFINPSPGYVLKTNNGEKKVFINMCKSDKVAEPKAVASYQEASGGMKPGINWTMPYSIAPGREDVDKGGQTCKVYDVVFHPKCFENAIKDPRLKDLMESSALDGIEREMKENLDRTNVRRPKLKFKGEPQSSIIRTPTNATGPLSGGQSDAVTDLNLPYPFDKSKQNHKDDRASDAPADLSSKISGTLNPAKTTGKQTAPAEPKYSITHRGHFDMQHFTNARDSMPSTRPQELVILIELPLLKSAASVQLDVFEKQIKLHCEKPAAYKLDLQLPFPVYEEKGGAKFDKSKSCLIITLPVLPPNIPAMPTFAPQPEKPALIQDIHDEQNGDVEESSTDLQGKNANEPNKPTLIEEIKRKSEIEESNPHVHNSKDNEDIIYTDDNPEDKGIKEVHVESDRKESAINTDHSIEDGALDSDDDLPPNPQPKENPTSTTAIQSQADACIEESEKAICPHYIFKQDLESVTFIIYAQNIDKNSLKNEILVNGNSSIRVQFKTKTSSGEDNMDGSFQLYCLNIQFEDGCTVGKEIKMELTDKGAVLVMAKEHTCQGDWSGFKAGVSTNELKDKKFLTESNIMSVINQSVAVHTGPQMEVAVKEVSDQKLVVDFELMDTVPREKDGVSESALQPATDVINESHIREASEYFIKSTDSSSESLSLDLNHNHTSDCTTSMATCSETSPPSTPSSATSLKSAIKWHRIQHSKSVSFSEDVEVEVLVSPGKTKRGKRRPLVARRSIERLKDTAQSRRRRYHSDSEVTYNPSGGGDFWMENLEEDFKKILLVNQRPRSRHSSSESESSQDGCGSTRAKGKKSKGSKKHQKKQKSNRELGFGGKGREDEESGDTLESTSSDGTNSPTKDLLNRTVVAEKASEKNNPEKVSSKESSEQIKVVNGCDKSDGDTCAEEDDNVTIENLKTKENTPLELQDHTTKCAVAFQNEVMFDLDD